MTTGTKRATRTISIKPALEWSGTTEFPERETRQRRKEGEGGELFTFPTVSCLRFIGAVLGLTVIDVMPAVEGRDSVRQSVNAVPSVQ